ncbi:MAG: dihydrodipicolinate synthase family protein [Marinilabiliaceae bacterium]|jgi:4-hydroxy-2-oxoglutarate aldolase|nr:dihydrodipicolinate synthase family protein [Marinilabiliaceae bacterium]
MNRIEGIFPPLPTSFSEDGKIFPEKIKENIENLLRFDLAGILILGSNGELVMLTEKEKEQAYRVAREAIPSDRTMIAGTGGQSTAETIERTLMAAESGADAALVLNPFYYKGQMNDKSLINHYHKVADASKIPVLIYNMPANSGIDMEAGTLISIAQHPNIVGLKDSGGNIVKMGAVIEAMPEDFTVLAGSASFLLPALSIGAKGGILALANIAPALCLDIRKAFLDNDLKKAAGLQRKAIEANTAVTRKWGVPALKAAMDYTGNYGGPVREPLLEFDRALLPELYRIVDKVIPA